MGDSSSKDKRICVNCGIDKSIRRGWSSWRHYKDGFLCEKCYTRLISNPRLLHYKDKFIFLKENPRKGICSWCGKKGITQMHHFAEYHDDDPLKDTVEICVACHKKVHGINRWMHRQ
jgi:hypothetical protein